MIAYYLPGPENIVIRTENTGSSILSMKLENMMTLATSSISMSSYTFNNYENLLNFNLIIPSASVGSEYRAYISDSSGSSIWHGSIQVYVSQSIEKADYQNQIPLENQYVSNVTPNRYTEYIIL
jgi:hypothetical protein